MSRERERLDEIGKKLKTELYGSMRRRSDDDDDMLGTGKEGRLNTITPCAACKLLRRRCAEDCPFSPYFSPHEPHRFAAVHKVFGASNVSKLLMEVHESQRADAANSMVYEANVRLREPVYGCMGAISALQQQVQSLRSEINDVQTQILRYKYKQAAANAHNANANANAIIIASASASASALINHSSSRSSSVVSIAQYDIPLQPPTTPLPPPPLPPPPPSIVVPPSSSSSSPSLYAHPSCTTSTFNTINANNNLLFFD